MFLLVSIATEAFRRMMTMRLLYRQLGIDVSATRDVPELLRNVRGSFGGRLVLLDWSTGDVLADRAIPGVSGMAIREDAVLVGSWIDNCIYVLQPRCEPTAITHPWFNYIHSIDLTADGSVLVASAGSDLIVEIAEDGAVRWDWFGPEHGYATAPDGTPTLFDRGVDYRGLRRSTAEQAMHVTSAIQYSEKTVLATLFHQGTLIAIDRVTRQPRTILEGMSRPHGIHARNGGFIVTDTLGRRILLLNDDLDVCDVLQFGTQWVQDTIVTSSGTLVVLENVHIDQLPEPGLSNRIAELDMHGRLLRQLEIGPELRLFTARELEPPLAYAFAASWGKQANFDQWRWSVAA